MKTKLLFGLSILLFSSILNAKVTVEYRVSRVHGLLDFVMAISGEPHHAPALKETFVRSKFDIPESRAMLADLEKCKDALFRNIQSENGKSLGRGDSTYVLKLMITQSLLAKNVSDFGQRILGQLPLGQHLTFFKVLRYFEPIYDSLIWKKHQKELLAHKIQLEKMAKKIDLNQMFAQADQFYRANWPQEAPFLIGLYAVPFLKDFKNSTNSASNGMVEEHGVLVGQKSDDLASSFGVIFHELCHSLFDAQSVEFQNEFEKYFKENPSPYGKSALFWINETLATALGNGWAYERAEGKLDTTSWYNQETIDGFSHAIYDLTKKYVSSSKPMDQEFVNQAIALFAERFPDSIYEFKTLFANVHLIHNQSFMAGPTPKKHVREILSTQNYQGSAPINHKLTLEGILESSNTCAFVLNDKEVSELGKLAESIPFIKGNLKTIREMPNRSYWAKLDEKSRGFVVIKVSSEEEFKSGLKAIKEAGRIDLKTELHSF
jgi:hypothetical protein